MRQAGRLVFGREGHHIAADVHEWDPLLGPCDREVDRDSESRRTANDSAAPVSGWAVAGLSHLGQHPHHRTNGLIETADIRRALQRPYGSTGKLDSHHG